MDVWTEPTAAHCSHIFCSECIDQGIKNKKECPLCKSPILSRRHLMPMQSLANLVEEFHKFKKKFDQSLSIASSCNNTCKSETIRSENPSSSMGSTYEELCSLYPDPLKDNDVKTPTSSKAGSSNAKRNSVTNIYSSGATSGGRKRRFIRNRSSSSVSDGNTSDSSTSSVGSAVIRVEDEDVDENTLKRTHEDITEFENELNIKKLRLSQIEDLLSDLNGTYGVFGFSFEKFPVLTSLVNSLEGSVMSVSTGVKSNSASQMSDSSNITPPIKKRALRQKSKNIVICGTNLDSTQKKLLDEACKYLGAKVVSDMSADVTHLVASIDEERLARRTIKYCIGVVRGLWIVGPEWLSAVISNKGHVDEENYCALGDVVIKKNAPLMGRESIEAGLPLLFSGKRIYFFGTFDAASKSPSKKELTDLVTQGGGVVSNQIVKKLARKSKYENMIIAGNDLTQDEAETIENETGLKCVQSKWLLDCVSQFKVLDTDDFVFFK